jgi:uncharacterized membrane protein
MDARILIGMTLSMLALDVVWLTLRNGAHQTLFRGIQGTSIQPRILPALLIYILIPVAVYLVAVRDSPSEQETLVRAALVGFFLYAFYDLTNYATFTNWTLSMTVTDIVWGTALCTIGGFIGARLSRS